MGVGFEGADRDTGGGDRPGERIAAHLPAADLALSRKPATTSESWIRLVPQGVCDPRASMSSLR